MQDHYSNMLLISLMLLLASLSSTQELQCHIPGECTGIVVGANLTDTYNDCLDQCKSKDNCNWFTHLGATNECRELYDCQSMDTNCFGCFSGQMECGPKPPTCEVVGVCNGLFVASEVVGDVKECLKFCQETDMCRWYTYFGDSGDCVLTENCLAFDESCTSCISGEKECKIQIAYYKVEVIDLSNNSKTCTAPSDFPGADDSSVGAFMNDTDVIVCGGYNRNISGSDSKCYNYVPTSNLWVDSAFSLRTEREGAAAVIFSPNYWLVTGGYRMSAALNSSEMLNFGQEFIDFVDMPEALGDHNLVAINSSHVLLLGGNRESDKVWLLNVETQTWTSLPGLLIPTYYAQAGLATLSDGSKELVAVAGPKTNATQIYSFTTQQWRMGLEFPAGFSYVGCSVQYQDTFLVVGGHRAGSQLDSIFEYQPDSEGWKQLPQKLTIPREQFACFLVPDDFVPCT